MRRVSLTILPVLFITAGCRSASDLQTPVVDTTPLRHPESVVSFLSDQMRSENVSAAYKALAPGTVSYEAFYFALGREFVRGVTSEWRQHGLMAGPDGTFEATVCNLRYGFTETLRIVPLFGGRQYGIDMPREQLDRLVTHALKVWDVEGDFYIHPMDARPPRRWKRCACKEPA